MPGAADKEEVTISGAVPNTGTPPEGHGGTAGAFPSAPSDMAGDRLARRPRNSAQPDAIHRAANFPEMFSQRARVRVTRLIVVFAACAVSCVGRPESNYPCDINSGTEAFIRAQHGVARGGLKPKIANRFRRENG